MLSSFFRNVALVSLLALAQSAFAQTTVTLMQDLNGYTGTTDSWLWAASPNTNREGDGLPLRTETQDSAVIRFAIFESEGGPIPNGSTIHSATLSLYKWNGPEGVFKASRLLKSFNESQVTWNNAATGTSWTTPGANSASNDYLATADGQASVGDAAANGCGSAPYPAACWLNIDVTSGVQAFGSGTANYGWKLALVSSSDPNYKAFDDSENQSFPTLRPKLTITYTVPTGSTATLMEGQNGYVGTTDSWLWAASPNTNKNGEGLPLRTETQDSAVIRFAIFESEGGLIPNGSTIHSATLSLYKWNGPDGVFKASRLLKSFNQSQVTWNVAATGTAWTTPGANSAGNDYLATADGQASVGDAAANGCGSAPYPAACWLNINVTSGVQAFGSGTANYGWKLALVSSSNPNYKAFDDSENQSFPTLRPKLTVNYTPPDTCAVPTANFTWNQNPAGSLNVTFNASSSADGSYPITSLRLQFGDGQEVTWDDKNQTQSHSYAAYTTYNATLTATNQCGTSAPKTLPVTPTPGGVPTASFTWSQNPGSLNVTFNASGSADGGAPITSLRLRFGHGNPEQEITWNNKALPQAHTYPGPGTYTATLTATNSFGTSPGFSQQIEVTDGTDNPPGSGSDPAGSLGLAVPTFHSMGLYYNPESEPANCTTTDGSGCKIWMRYRRASELDTAWREGFPLWFDPRTSGNQLPYAYRARGSAVYLEPGTKYYFEFGTGSSYAAANWQHYVAGTTRPATIPEDPNVTPIQPRIPSQGPLVITVGGSPGAYKVYDGWNGSTRNVIDRSNHGLDAGPNPSRDDIDEPHLGTAVDDYKDPSFGIVIKASYVIVRRVTVQGAAAANILIYPNMTDVVIEDSEIKDWSWRAGSTWDDSGCDHRCEEQTNPNTWGVTWPWGVNEVGGIHVSGNNSRIVIQRNVIKEPHHGAFPWDTHPDAACSVNPNDHPYGPVGITIYHGGQQNVIRYNDISGHASDNKRWLMDGIAGKENFGRRVLRVRTATSTRTSSGGSMTTPSKPKAAAATCACGATIRIRRRPASPPPRCTSGRPMSGAMWPTACAPATASTRTTTGFSRRRSSSPAGRAGGDMACVISSTTRCSSSLGVHCPMAPAPAWKASPTAPEAFAGRLPTTTCSTSGTRIWTLCKATITIWAAFSRRTSTTGNGRRRSALHRISSSMWARCF